MSGHKRLMIIAGGDWQVPVIQKAKEMGCFVINSNLYEDSPGFKYADVGLVADVLDKEKNLAFAQKYKPDGIITDQSDIAVSTVAYICEKLNLPGIGNDKAELFTDKFRMRTFCKENGFLYPEFQICTSFEEAKTFAHQIGYPVVIKPTSNQSSRGVFKINNAQQLEQLLPEARKFSFKNGILVEAFIGGTEITIEGICVNGKHRSLVCSEKDHFQNNEMVACRLLYSHLNPRIPFEKAKDINDSLVNKMGLPFGLTHAEYKYDNGKFYLVEIAARGGGTKISSLIVPFMSSVNTNEILINSALGENIADINPVKKDAWTILDFFYFEAGLVREMIGIEKLRANSNILDFAFNFKTGDVLRPLADDRSRHGYFIAYENTEDKLLMLCDSVKKDTRIVYR
ncbi:MAG: ATP-grasp domain-containing protein [Deltaproteobacteria bacterium]